MSGTTEKATVSEETTALVEDDGCAAHGKGHKGAHGHSHWMMLACCVPMLVVAVVLLVGGAGLASLAPAVMCAAMMGLMMVVMMRMHG